MRKKAKSQNKNLDEANQKKHQDESEEHKKNHHKAERDYFKVFKIFKLNSHKKIERKIMSFSLMLGVFIFSIFLGTYHNSNYNKEQASIVTGEGTTVNFSKTSDPEFNLKKIQLSSDKKTAYVPFQFNSMENLSTDANNYKVFVLPTAGKLSYKPTGQLIMFGTTGKGAIIIHSSNEIPNEPLHILLRNDKNLSTDESDQDDEAMSTRGMSSLNIAKQKTDMLDFRINPASKQVISNKELGTKDTSSKLYNQLFAKEMLKKITDNNKQNEKNIKINISQSEEYMRRLKVQGFDVPNQPKWLSEDWKPFDAIGSDGVPQNLVGKMTSEEAASKGYDDTNVNAENNPDVSEKDLPEKLKRADGSTTEDNNNSSYGNYSDDNIDQQSDSSSDESPATTWANLRTSWTNILQYKRTIYVTNAAAIFQLESVVKSQDNVASIGKDNKFKVLIDTVYN